MEKTGRRFPGDSSTELFSAKIQAQVETRDTDIQRLKIDN
jgi:hypothetical protein